MKDASYSSLKKEKKFLQILDNEPHGLFTMDEEGRINYFNAAAEQITGISTAVAMGKHCKEVFKSPTCRTDCPLRKAAKTGEGVYNRELVVTRADGKKVPVICSFSALQDHHGHIVGGMEVFIDISDRMRLENDLKISERRYRRIFEGSQDMILVTTKEGIISDINQAGVNLLGYSSKQELLEMSSVEEIYDNPKHWQVFQKQINREGFLKDFEAAFRKKDGTRLHCLLSGNATRGKQGEIIGYEAIAKDVTARMDAIRSFRQRHWELWLLNSVAFAMNRTQDLNEILITALTKVLGVLNLSAGGIFLIDHEKHCFSLRAQQGFTDNVGNKTAQILFRDKPLMRSLLKKELSLKPEPIFPPFRVVLKDGFEKNPPELTCFLITAKEKASGFLAFEVPPNRDLTTGKDYNLLGSLGNFLGGAIENALLNQTIQKHREELQGLTARLFYSQEDERKRIARELHDEAGQSLTGLNFMLETIEKKMASENTDIKDLIKNSREQVRRTYDEIRRISYRLHPALLSDLGLEPALESYLNSISKHSKLKVNFRMVGFESRLDQETEIVLYRLSQEAFTNALKHSRGKHFKLSIIKGYPKIIFLAEDDGIGFDSGEFHKPKHALGLLSMSERTSMAGGNFSLRTSPGKGTRIRIEIPIRDSFNDR